MRSYRRNSSNEGWLLSYADLITNLLIFFILIISASSIQTGKMEKIIASISDNQPVESLSAAKDKVEQELAKQHLTNDVRVELTDDGLEIIFDSGVTFASGKAEILPEMEEPLMKVLRVLGPYASKYKMAIEGHTDERPIHSNIYKSNWELSSARAMRIRERLVKIGIPEYKMRVEAYADTKPIKKELREDLDEKTLHAKHRRVVIRLY